MAKKNQKRLISKKTKKMMTKVAPWAIAVAATGGMIAALADRAIRGKVRTIAADTVEKVRPHAGKTKSDGMANGMVAQESGAV